MSRACLIRLLLATALPLLGGCGDDEEPTTTIRLRLTVKPELNTEAQVLAALDRIEFVFDAAGGFENVPAQGGKVGPLDARDVDQDGEMELVLDEPVGGSRTFPLLRLLPGSNLARDFSIRAVGFAGAQPAAVGGAAAVKFTEGESIEVAVPLDLCDAHLPPRVLYTVPGPGENIGEQDLKTFHSVRVYLSKVIDASTVKSNLRVIHEPTGQPVEGGWELEELASSCLGTPEKRSLAVFVVDGCLLHSGSYWVEASSDLRDLQGVALDQTALQQGTDGFESSFSVTRTVPPPYMPCSGAGGGGGCLKDEDCPPDERCEVHDPTDPKQNRCVPLPDCGGVCPAGYVCSPELTCVRDCREAGACVSGACSEKSGLCGP